MMANVSDFCDRLVMTQGSPQLLVLSHGRVHTLWPAPAFCESQRQVPRTVRSSGKLLVCVSAARARRHSAQNALLPFVIRRFFTTHTTLLWDIFNSKKRASSMPWIPKPSPFRFLRVLLKDGPNQRSDLYAQTANPLTEKSVFQSEDLKNLCKPESGDGWESPVCLVFMFVNYAMVVAVELLTPQILRWSVYYKRKEHGHCVETVAGILTFIFCVFFHHFTSTAPPQGCGRQHHREGFVFGLIYCGVGRGARKCKVKKKKNSKEEQ